MPEHYHHIIPRRECIAVLPCCALSRRLLFDAMILGIYDVFAHVSGSIAAFAGCVDASMSGRFEGDI